MRVGMLLFDERRFDDALEAYRAGAMLAPTSEWEWESYFDAAHRLHRTDEAIALPEQRMLRYRDRSSLPARTLARALFELSRYGDAFAVLEREREAHPEDGPLLLYEATHRARRGEFGLATGLLEGARGRAKPREWLRAAAEIANFAGDGKVALAYWREIVSAEPHDIDAQHELVDLMRRIEGSEVAESYLETLGQSNHYELAKLQLVRSMHRGRPRLDEALCRFLAAHPDDVWARRERANALIQQACYAEARSEAERAIRLDPHSPWGHLAHARALEHLGDAVGARNAYREAIRLEVDTAAAIDGLVTACDTDAERREALRFVQSELERQVVFGDGIDAFRTAARAVLSPDEVAGLLHDALEARPDSWRVWSANVSEERDANADIALRPGR